MQNIGGDAEPIIEEVIPEKKNKRASQRSPEKPKLPATDDASSVFECNICLEAAKEPVVT